MTLETKILADQARASTGHTSSPTGDVKPSSELSITGGPAYRKRPPHVVNAGQGIFHREEHTTDLRTLIYKEDDGQIDPGMYSRYMIRASADLSISLGKTPAVPADQVHPDGVARIREADVEVVIFSATAASITWPAGVVWGRLGYEIAGDPAALSELQGPPVNPRPAGTADRFMLTYNERTGEWWAIATHLAVAAADPSGQAPETTEPEAPEEEELEPGEDATEDTPENEYTDPETGTPLAPEAPEKGAGNLIALHAGGISYSMNGGYTWLISESVPHAAADISAIAGEGAVIRTTDGMALFSSGLSSFRRINLERTEKSGLVIENGDFESGDLTGWELLSGTAPMVLDTVQPPQQGGEYYLGSNLDDPDYEIRTVITVPSSDDVQVSARVHAAPDALYSFAIYSESGRIPVPEILLTNWNGTRIDGYAKTVSGDLIDLELTSGSLSGLVGNGSTGTRKFQAKYSSDNSTYTGAIPLRFIDIDTVESLRFPSDKILDVVTPDDFDGYVDFGETYTTVYTGSNGQTASVIFKDGSDIEAYMELNLSSMSLGSSMDFIPDHVFGDPYLIEEKTAFGTGEWEDVSIAVTPASGTEISIVLKGEFGPVYFDDVSAEVTRQVPGTVKAITRDLASRRHVIATEGKIWAVKGGMTVYVAEAPFAPDFIAAEGNMIVIASGQNIAVSTDNGQNFTADTVPAAVAQLFAIKPIRFEDGSSAPSAVAALSDGKMVRISKAVAIEIAALPAAGTIAKDSRRLNWLFTTPGGDVHTTGQSSLSGHGAALAWSDRKDMPASVTELSRRIFGTDSGRTFGYIAGSKDLFWSDDLTASWKLGRSLTRPIILLEEIK
jgi:hypothetical protein